ncbi:hypothetical protein ACFQT0_06295 [Hymenobacter humi]|uniref:Outer membrane protein beta-barrel domain-containing protein n=1 Tax=Hymenobacter humi TaxID=1411620 RepID=A0ABW2U3T0_9BACT
MAARVYSLLLVWLAGILMAGPAAAQTSTAAPASQWGWGARLGLGPGTGQYGDLRHDYSYRYTGAVGSLLVTRYFTGPRVSLGLEVMLESQSVLVDYQRATPIPTTAPKRYTNGGCLRHCTCARFRPSVGYTYWLGAAPRSRWASPTPTPPTIRDRSN